MTTEDRRLLEEIRDQNRRILAALEDSGLLAPPSPPRRKGDPSLLETMTEAEKMSEILRTQGREAMKAAMKRRNEEARARRKRRQGHSRP